MTFDDGSAEGKPDPQAVLFARRVNAGLAEIEILRKSWATIADNDLDMVVVQVRCFDGDQSFLCAGIVYSVDGIRDYVHQNLLDL